MRNISQIRKEYMMETLEEHQVAANPLEQFERWWDNAINSSIDEINAMTLATVNENGLPDARVVLLKGYGQEGFVFFTNYQSAKGRQLDAHPYACLVFYWKELERQVRIEGRVSRISEKESDHYFSSRPEGSKIGAWASPQSQVIPDRHFLERLASDAGHRFEGRFVERPRHWGGYCVVPDRVEFWQGRASRLHDRIRYSHDETGLWKIERLAP
jgi:pyridoxamine 5'-phosphate oxidase